MKADYVHKDSRTLEEKPQVFARWIDPTIEELQQENQSLKKENKILRENAEHNDKVVDKVNWENKLLKKENKQLKDNWNKLKEYLNYKSERAVGEDEYVYDEIYNEMQEMEKNYGNVENNT